MERERDDTAVERLRELADRLGFDVGSPRRRGVEGNTAGIETEDVLVSRRLDSRTFFVQNRRFGVAMEGGGAFEGPDEEIIEQARNLFEQLETPVEEIAESTVLTEQAQEGQVDADTGQLHLGPAYAGKRLALLTRQVDKLPVWSSRMLLGLAWDRSVGFLEHHWPNVPSAATKRAHELESAIAQGWRPPELPGATVSRARRACSSATRPTRLRITPANIALTRSSWKRHTFIG